MRVKSLHEIAHRVSLAHRHVPSQPLISHLFPNVRQKDLESPVKSRVAFDVKPDFSYHCFPLISPLRHKSSSV